MKIFDDIRCEREYQDKRWGKGFDDSNTLNDWIAYIAYYCSRAHTMNASGAEQRKALVKVAALAVASLETFDRNGQFKPRHYDLLRGKE